MNETAAQVVPEKSTGSDDRLAHLVLDCEWPTALCGATVQERFGFSAPGRDRCLECMRVARERGLGRPAWGKS